LLEIGLGEPQLFVASQRQVQPPPGTGCSKYTLDTSLMLQLLCQDNLAQKSDMGICIWQSSVGGDSIDCKTIQGHVLYEAGKQSEEPKDAFRCWQ